MFKIIIWLILIPFFSDCLFCASKTNKLYHDIEPFSQHKINVTQQLKYRPLICLISVSKADISQCKYLAKVSVSQLELCRMHAYSQQLAPDTKIAQEIWQQAADCADAVIQAVVSEPAGKQLIWTQLPDEPIWNRIWKKLQTIMSCFL